MTTTPQLTDPRPALLAALDQAGRLVHEVGPADLTRPTPCTEYDVRGLLGHLVAVEGRIAHILTGGQPFEVPSVVQRPADGWASAWDDARSRLDAVLADDACLEGTVTHPIGVLPAAAAISIYVSEVATHGWDLAMALGRRGDLDDAVAEPVLGPIRRALPPSGRDGMPFGEPVPVGDDATPYDALVAWTGRDPRWTP